MKSSVSFSHGVLAFVFVFLAGLVQNTDLLSINHLKPNLVFVTLAALAFFISSAPFYALLAVFADVIIRFHPFFDRVDFAFLVVVLASYWLSDRLPSKPFVNYVMIVTFGTFLFYLIAAPSFILKAPFSVFFEVVYNNIVGFIIFLIFQSIFKNVSTRLSTY